MSFLFSLSRYQNDPQKEVSLTFTKIPQWALQKQKWNWTQMAVEGECRLRATKWEARADETSLISCNSNKEQYLSAEFFWTELFRVPAFIANQCTELLPWALYVFIMHQVVFFCTHLPCLYFKYCNQKRIRFPRAKLSEVYEVSYANRQSKQYSEKHLP